MRFLSLLLLLFSFNAFAQKNEPFRIDSLPKQGILLDKGWKWHAGDNPDWAKPDFDDSAWESIDPTKDIHYIPPFAKTGIGWLRLKLSLSNHLQKEQFALLIKQYIASEIYLNGRLLYRFGKISANSEEVLAYNPESSPVSVPINFSGNQILAVRYAFQSNIKFGTDQSTQIPLLEVKFITSNDAFKQVSINERHLPVTNTFRIGAYVILAFLYLAFFFYNPSYKAYLFFFLFAIFEMPQDILQFNYPPEIEEFVFAIRVTNILWQLSQLFLLTGMYFLLNQKKGWVYWTLVILSFIGIILNNWVFSELLVVNLISLELVRTCFKSLKLKTRGSWIISTGAICFLFFMGAFYAGVSFELSLTNIKLGESYTVLDVLYGAGQLCIPIATTIHVALDFGFTSHALQQKLVEVEKLSQKTIAQEKEKQQILATQNETLEKQVAERTAELEHKNRDLEIEASLEKVRARALEMQKSNEIMDVAVTLYDEMQKLDFEYGLAAIVIFDSVTGDMETWYAGFNYNKYPESYHIGYFEHPFQKAILSAWRNGERFLVYSFTNEEKQSYDEYIFSKTNLKNIPAEVKKQMMESVNLAVSLAFTKHGAINWSPTLLSEEKTAILQRFAFVFEQAYIRFLDLQKAEAQTREAQIEAALERVRSQSLAMHRSDELKNVMIVLFEKMKELGVVNDGGVGIYLFTEGSKDCVLWVISQIYEPNCIALPYNEEIFSGNTYLSEMFNAKASGTHIFNKVYSFEEKNRYFDYVFANNGFDVIPPFVRDFIKSAPSHTCSGVIEKNSSLGVDSWQGQLMTETEFEILKRVGRVFEQAYIRFMDLQKAEEQAEQAKLDLIQIQTEKKRAEDALIELRITQSQLIQKEKLASLGELTAGIAHEIQNPLNFVNNFSELSVELIEELAQDLPAEIKTPPSGVGGLLEDLTQNLEKINHHGKRASSIVKGMLEHSRMSTGERQLTDLNALCDEYLRLSYHGMRAKDKNFNADYKLIADPNLPKINVVPQDIGRVLLNLINNAFYAVYQRNNTATVETLHATSLQSSSQKYQPTVIISTQQSDSGVPPSQIVIKIKDNGAGIPADILPKIFQPFFTTKPTGEGTGLGLSLSYDIVTKGHEGTLEVESLEGEGATFIVTLPL